MEVLNHIFTFFISALFVYFSFVFTCYVLANNDRFNSSYRQQYIAKNITKSFFLFLLTIWGIPNMLIPILFNNWDSNVMRTCAAVYGSIDFIGLLVVPNNKLSTKIHHVVCIFLIFSSFFVSFEEINVSRILAIYAIFSTFAFSVNAYLGLKWLDFFDRLRRFAFWNYVVCCVCNWSLVLYTVYEHNQINGLDYTYYVVLSLLMALVYDDIVLMKALYKDKLRKKID
jgi:hypothetical protein